MRDKKDILIVLQARTGSSRLPNKVVDPFFENISIFEIIAKKLLDNFDHKIVLATTLNPKDDKLIDLAFKLGLESYRGSEDNVLERFINCAEKFEKKSVVRICCDNPFIDIALLKELVISHCQEGVDYSSFITDDKTPAIKTHYGIFAEVVELLALKKVTQLTQDPLYCEHVTNFIYANPEVFKLNFISMPHDISNMKFRLTLDTKEDWDILNSLYAKCVSKYTNFGWKDVLSELKNEKHTLLIMEEQIKRFSK